MEANSFSYAIKVCLHCSLAGSFIIGLWGTICIDIWCGLACFTLASLFCLIFSLPFSLLFSVPAWLIKVIKMNDVAKMILLSFVYAALTIFFLHCYLMYACDGDGHLELFEVYCGAIYYLPAIVAIVWFYPK